MRVVELIMDGISKDPSGGVTKLSEDIAFYNKLDPAVVRRWALSFIQNDTLHVEVKRGTKINKAGIEGSTVNNHLRGSSLGDDSEFRCPKRNKASIRRKRR